jgi:gluconate 2-dehydrogenase alpha chain
MQHDQFRPDEVHNNVRALVTTGSKARREIPTFRRGSDQRARPAESGMTMMNAVGGTSIHYYANSWRFHPWDFKARSESVKRYGPNSIPRGSTIEDWPLT